MSAAKPRTQALGGVILAIIAVALVTAILTSAVSASSADGRTEALASKLEKVTNDLTALRDEQKANQRSSTKARSRLMRDNATLLRQNRSLQQKLLIVIRALRANGIEVPPSALAPSSSQPNPKSSTTRPKAPRPTSRATPRPTVPSPSGPRPSPAASPCGPLPGVCIPPLPTALLLP